MENATEKERRLGIDKRKNFMTTPTTSIFLSFNHPFLYDIIIMFGILREFFEAGNNLLLKCAAFMLFYLIMVIL